jgi:putative addiction module component (TIGR02574 family)
MTREAADLLREALKLPPKARAALADSLLESSDSEVDPEAGQAWREEIAKRLAEIDDGAVALVPREVAMRRLLARFQR